MVNFLKIGATAVLLLFLSGCTQYKYDVTWKSCNGIESGSLSYIDNADSYPRIQEGKSYSSPTLRDNFGDSLEKRNVCDFEYTKTEVKEVSEENNKTTNTTKEMEVTVSLKGFITVLVFFSCLLFIGTAKNYDILVERMVFVTLIATLLFIAFLAAS